MADHIFQKKNESTWYVRLDIPKDVRRALGNRTVLTQSLKTGMRSEAMVRRLPILSQWKADIAAARAAKGNKGDVWRSAQHQAGLGIQSRRNEAVNLLFTPHDLASPPPRPEKSSDTLIQQYHDIAAELKGDGFEEFAIRFTNHANKMSSAIADGMTAVVGIGLQHDLLSLMGDMEAACIAEEYYLSDAEHREARTIVHNPTVYKPRSPITPSMIEDWAKHLVTQIESAKTRDSHKSRIEKISEFLTTEGAPLTFDTIHNFVKEQGGARQTLLNYLWSGRGFWKYAIKYNAEFREEFAGQQCPFDGHELPKVGKEAGEPWIPFTRKEVEDLHKMARDAGKDELVNLIVFGAYTGARIEEIGRIEPGDTILDNDGEPIGFHIPEAKSVAGVRDIPLHPSLIPLYKKLCTQAPANDGYLFKGGRNKYDIRLDRLGKQFGRMKTKAEFSRLHVFHSIRKTTTTELHQAGVGLEVLPYIIGHENKSFTLSVYSAGCSFEQKQAAIQHLSFDFENK